MAVNALMQGESYVATVKQEGKFKLTPLQDCLVKRNEIDNSLLDLLKTLAI